MTEHTITPGDLQNLMRGEGGVDLERIIENGTQVSMRIVGVTPGTTAARLGAQNDDMLDSINDVPLTSVAAAYQAAADAAKQDRITLKGSRRGEPYTTVLIMKR